MKTITSKARWLLLFLIMGVCHALHAQTQTFVHPGGLHTQADLDRMKEKVAAGESPWIEGWNQLIADSKAQHTYTPAARANMGDSRQRADADAHAAYLNAIRWHISGDTRYAECAVRILNAWSGAVNQVPTGQDISGLAGIAIFDFAMAAEVLRVYPGWAPADFDRFKTMMITYFYPVVHDFLVRHNNACISHYWANWDICNIGALLAMGVLCDNEAIYNEGVEYFKNGAGNGSIKNAIPFLHADGLAQWQESGRDQPHAQLGVGMMAYLCQIAWNQGLDLFGYDDNRFLKGAEYVARTNLSQPVPYTAYNNCHNANQRWLSDNGIGRLDRPVYELIYNHYVVRKGMSAPHVKAMAEVLRPERGSLDHFGYGTLTFTLDKTASPYPASPAPATPTGLTAYGSVGRVDLAWAVPAESNVQNYTILRATTAGGPYTTIGTRTRNSYPRYTDGTAENGTTYYYAVVASNQAGSSSQSAAASARPLAVTATLPGGWGRQDIGTAATAGSASYAPVNNHTFQTTGAGSVGGTADACGFTYGSVTGDFTLTARVLEMGGTQGKTGIMVRESLDPNAKAFVMKRGDAGWRQAGFGMRTSTGGSMSWRGGNDYTWLPAWFRLQRVGNVVTGYESPDGVDWFEVGTATVEMGSNCYAGLLSSSGSSTSLSTATFDNVSVVNPGATAPDAPTGFTAVAGNMQNTLSWDAVAGVGFTVKRATVSGGPYTIITANIMANEYADAEVENGTTYYYVVTASNFGGESAASAEVNATPQLSIPTAPADVTAVSASEQQIKLSWSESLSAIMYQVKRSEVKGGPYTTIGSPTTNAYMDENLITNKTYYYVISAVNSLGESVHSSEVFASPGRLGFWKFDETSGTTAQDSWGSLDGTLFSGASWVPGVNKNAVQVDGASSGYVALPEGIVREVNDFTIAAWVRLDELKTWARIFDFGTENANSMYLTPETGVVNGKSTIRFGIKTAGVQPIVTYDHEWQVGTWTHIAVTLSGTTAKLYVNGSLAGTNTNFNKHPSDLGHTTKNYLGKGQKSDDPMLKGAIDDFRLYNAALSASEIEDMVTISGPPPTPVISSVTSNQTEITLNWTGSLSAGSYNVKRSTVSGGPYTLLGSTAATSYTDTGLNTGDIYYYVVSAENEDGESENSGEAVGYLTGKISYWMFDETSGTTALDSWGDNNGTLGETATREAGKYGQALKLDGVGTSGSGTSYASLPGSIAGTFSGDFTISYWVKLSDLTGTFMRLFDFGNNANSAMYMTPQTAVSGGKSTIRFGVKASSTSQQTLVYDYAWTLDTWTHLAVTLSNSTNTVRLYINGVQVAANTSFTLRPSFLVPSSKYYLGRSNNVNDKMLHGAIDEFKIYNTVLSAAEIASEMKVPQTITFDVLDNKAWGDDDFDAGATATSGLPVSYSSSNPEVATIVNGKVHLAGIGTTTITARQEGNYKYSAATPVVQTLTVVDLTAPTAPTGLTSIKREGRTVELIWQPSTDNVGVIGYEVFLNGSKITTTLVTGTSYITEYPTGNQVYVFTVKAVDAAGNRSEASQEDIVTNGKAYTVDEDVVLIYPNPSKGDFLVSISTSEIGSVVIYIYDSSGNLVTSTTEFKSTPVYQRAFRLLAVSKGVYVVKVMIGDRVITKSLLLE